nr:GMC oxidoreductase [Alkalihalobacillus deserti]
MVRVLLISTLALHLTNRYGQVHGVSGLYVADNSILPSIGTLTTVALSIRVADYILSQFD